MTGLKQRVHKLESVAGEVNNDAYAAWLRSLSMDELEDALARQTTEIELGVTTQKPWHPPSGHSAKYSQMADAELTAELEAVEARLGMILDKNRHKPLLDKWRNFYADPSVKAVR